MQLGVCLGVCLGQFESNNIEGKDELGGQCVPNCYDTVRYEIMKFAHVILCQRYSQFEWVSAYIRPIQKQFIIIQCVYFLNIFHEYLNTALRS